MAYAKKSKEEKIEEVKAAQEKLTAALEEMVTGEDWIRWLNYQTKFHKYSANNCMLIVLQNPNATQVAGYETWKKLGRQVMKDEKSIRIFAPIKGARTEQDPATGEDVTRTWLRFMLVGVFDVSQTTGDPLPEAQHPVLLDGEAPEGLYDALAAQVAAAGYALHRGDCRGANGYTDYLARVVKVRDDVSEAQACKTLAHELAHVLLDHEHRGHGAEATITRDRMEVEAESVAYIVCSLHGLDSSGYTLGYVAHWADGSLAKVRETTAKVAEVAKRILDTTEVPAADRELVAA
jgi:hypothetical protein